MTPLRTKERRRRRRADQGASETRQHDAAGAEVAPRPARPLLTSIAPWQTSPARPQLDTEPSPLRWSARPRAPRRWWATRAGRSPGSRLRRIASAFPPVARQWHGRRRSPLTVAGAAAALRPSWTSYRVPFSPPRPCEGPRRDRHARWSKQSGGGAVNQKRARDGVFDCTMAEALRWCDQLTLKTRIPGSI